MTHNPDFLPADWQDPAQIGKAMHDLAARLFPINRSLTGDGVRESLALLRHCLPELVVHEVPTGTECFDWQVPDEWNVREAYIVGPDGRRVVDFRDHNLHLMGYSEPVDMTLWLEELQPHLHSLPELPEAIPYVTSYYRRRWGFCLAHRVRQQLPPGQYRVVIDATLAPGSLTYGDLLLPGENDQEILLSSYLCHPSMANNELSGPLVGVFLMAWLASLPRRRYSYRLMLVPETLGAIVYLARHLEHLKAYTLAGFNLSCLGDERGYSYLPSRRGDTLADRAALHALKHIDPGFRRFTFLNRGSNERQLCAPGVDLPIASVMRTKYGCFPEYHTSLDDLSLVTPAGLAGGFMAVRRAIECIEQDGRYQVTVLCEPQMGKRGLYPDLSTRWSGWQVRDMMNLLAYSDGALTLFEIAETIHIPFWKARQLADLLLDAGLLRPV
ncbi:DUF4910 domain-containing protein [Aeromonas caviae]|uniref:DUF4910 domain-containing protein n=1 Tax=Aeromonas caviae TaxID=648 RepID=A0A3S7P4M8_AERCA|nr:DUF4910 domain-containing protein [Aeromonas caviae]AXB03714.1 DUF4910 domain-containing protein [Aeromonas caviae]AXB08055.1 DUF4910 domain-containing protein [Aeromonas caviae]